MSGRKQQSEEPPPTKRRRTRQARRRRDQPPIYDYLNRADEYARHYTAAAIMAAVARRLGHPSVSPSDFYCGCPPSYRDGLPMCMRERENCRFANRPAPEVLAARETRRDEQNYDHLWGLATLTYAGPTLPRALWDRRRKKD